VTSHGSGASLKRPLLSPLRYPGGKGALYQPLRSLIRANGLTSGTYVEPYAGGAGAGIALLITGQVQRIVINDLDPCVYAFWRAAVEHGDEMATRTKNAQLTVKEWKQQKVIYEGADRDDYLTLGFAFFYLNRTNRSGVLNGGPIGGLDQSGPYKIDARFTKDTLLERLRLVALHAKRITVLNEDGLKVIKNFARKPDAFIYADPPYFNKAGSLYMNSFREDDHRALASVLNARADARWVLTYDDVPDVPLLYADRRRERFSLGYSARRVVKATEIIVYSDGLALPSAPERVTPG